MKKILTAFATCLTMAVSAPARPCGGPFFYPVGEVLSPIEGMLEQLLTPLDHFGDGYTIEPFLFLYPFHVDPARRAQVEDLWKLAYGERWAVEGGESAPSFSAASLEAFEAALRRADLDAAEAEARKLVAQVLDMPLALANQHQDNFARALEFLDLKPALTKVLAETLAAYFLFTPGPDRLWPAAPRRPWAMLSLPLALQQGWIFRSTSRGEAAQLAERFPQGPRAGTLGFIALQEKFRTEIPNGWLEEIRKNTSAKTWQGLEAAVDAWLTAFPSHPLADLARLTKLRAFYYQDKGPQAWDLLFEIYPRRLARVLGEMRFLLKQGLKPAHAGPAGGDPVLKTALLPFLPLEAEAWNRDWRIAERALPAPWAVNLQERLLSRAVAMAKDGKPLPEAFPARAANPSELWGQLRLMALLQAGRLDEALTQAQSLPSNESSDLLRARVFLARGEWTRALAVAKLPDDAKRYLVRVLFDAPTLQGICRGPAGPWREEACLALAARAAAKGDWNGGADFLENSPRRAKLWREAAGLSADTGPSGLLAFARFMKANSGKVFASVKTEWYRSLNFHLSGLKDRPKGPAAKPAADPWSPEEESRAIRDYFTANSERFYALKAYAAWLKSADPKNRAAAGVLGEADQTYNGLINWDNWNSPFWQDYLENSEWALAIREAGKKIR